MHRGQVVLLASARQVVLHEVALLEPLPIGLGWRIRRPARDLRVPRALLPTVPLLPPSATGCPWVIDVRAVWAGLRIRRRRLRVPWLLNFGRTEFLGIELRLSILDRTFATTSFRLPTRSHD